MRIISIRSSFWSPFACFSFPSDGLIYWQQKPDHTPNDNPWLRPYYRPRTADIEITAYALLAYTLEKDIGVGLPVSRWLSQQRNSLGGYSSTQVDPFSALSPNIYVRILQTDLWTFSKASFFKTEIQVFSWEMFVVIVGICDVLIKSKPCCLQYFLTDYL